MIVVHHLMRLLDAADKLGHILQDIVIIPYANPIGLSQNLLYSHIGRFSLNTGINFNREYPEVTNIVASRLTGKLSQSEPIKNVQVIRDELGAAIREFPALKEEVVMKKTLFEMAYDADVVLDLHCDSDAVMHMYTHDRLWPALSDLAAEIQSECHLLAPAAGGNPFDEACSCPWADLADKFPAYPIPMACEAVTIELRGESDVSTRTFSVMRYRSAPGKTNLSHTAYVLIFTRNTILRYCVLYRCMMISLLLTRRHCSASFNEEDSYQLRLQPSRSH
jgi:uncharacterized protein